MLNFVHTKQRAAMFGSLSLAAVVMSSFLVKENSIYWIIGLMNVPVVIAAAQTLLRKKA